MIYERRRGDFASLAVPDKLDLALVLEKNETVFLRERLVLIDELDEVALLGVGEFVLFGVVLSSHGQCFLDRFVAVLAASGLAFLAGSVSARKLSPVTTLRPLFFSSSRRALPATVPPSRAALCVSCPGDFSSRSFAQHREDQFEIVHMVAEVFALETLQFGVLRRRDAKGGF